MRPCSPAPCSEGPNGPTCLAEGLHRVNAAAPGKVIGEHVVRGRADPGC